MSRGHAHEADDATVGSGLRLRASRRGEVLGDTYRLLELIGAGGMAEVYSAEHLRLGRRFAVKVLRAGTSGQSLQRFRREARAIARIENEFVVGVVDCGETTDGTPFLVMELLSGEDLRALLEREGALPIPRAVNLVWEACQGVAAVHDRSLIHRDLKPENLFVCKRGTGQDWCRVLDFGIAKTDLSNSTTEGAVVGTVRYMAPEQLQDAASAGPSVDVYALGAVLYECLTGSTPHRGATVQELMFKILNEQPLRLDLARAEVPKPLAEAVHRALSKSPAQRFFDVRQFSAAIAPYKGLSAVVEFDGRAATVDLERALSAQASDPPARRQGYVALALVGLLGLGVGSTLRTRTVVAPANSVSTPSHEPRAVAASPSASAPAFPTAQSRPLLPVATETAAAVASAAAKSKAISPAPVTNAGVTPKAMVRAVSRPASVSPRVRFDSENPYGR